jgi:sugar lactone lactonase YvrE
MLIADRGNQRVRRLSSGGTASTVAGNGLYRMPSDGIPAQQGFLDSPTGIALTPSGRLLIADQQANAIRAVSAQGTLASLAGSSRVGGYTIDGLPGNSSLLNVPYGVATGPDGSIYYSEAGNHLVRRISPSGSINTVAGTYLFEQGGYGGDGGLAVQAVLNVPLGLAIDSQANLFISDALNSRIRKVTSRGIISTVAGTGKPGFSGDGGSGISAQLYVPTGLAIDSRDNLYIADEGNHRIRKLTPSGIITTVAGNGSNLPPNGEGGLAINANVPDPRFIAADPFGNIYYSETSYDIVRKIDANGTISTVAGNGQIGSSGDGGLAVGASLSNPSGLAVDATGLLYIADSGNNRIRTVLTNFPILIASPTALTLSATSGPTTLVNRSRLPRH